MADRGAWPPVEEVLDRARAITDLAHERAEEFSTAYLEVFSLIENMLHVVDEAQIKIAGLQYALQSNRRTGQAVGLLMGRYQITELEAFGRLKQASQDSHRKVGDIAEELLARGDLPTLARP